MDYFPNLEDSRKIIYGEKNYFAHLSKQDLIARNAKSNDEYKNIYIKSLKTFTNEEKHSLSQNISIIDNKTKNFKNFHNTPWKLVKICCDIENGFPHTIGKIIIIPENFFTYSQHIQYQTLIHEKVHVFQRLHPLFTNILIHKFWLYEIFGFNTSLPKTIRSNPDLNRLIYSRSGNVCYQTYNSTNPKSLSDSKLSDNCNTEEYEHPYEKMAYTIADILANNIIKNLDFL